MASGDRLAFFTPNHSEPPSANAAAWDTVLTSSADSDEKQTPVLRFDPSTNEHADFSEKLRNYGSGGFNVIIGHTSDGTGGNVKWDVTFKSFTDDVDNLGSKAFGAAPSGNTVTAAAPTAANEIVYDTITVSDGADMDSIANGEQYHLRVTRDAADAADTLNSNDAFLVSVEITEQ